MSAADLLSRRAYLTPDRIALIEVAAGASYTFAELDRRANRLANFASQQLGIMKGDRVSILAHNSVVYVDLLFGLAKIGAILAPLNWRLTARELAYILHDCQPRALICGPEFTPLLAELAAEAPVEHVLSIDGARIDGALDYDALLQAASNAEPPAAPVSGEDPCCILYTSGTTGLPKGAVLPHRQVLWNAINTVASWGLTADDVAPILTPMFHAGGLFIFLTPLIYIGGRVVLARTFDVSASLRLIQELGCTVVLGVPTVFRMWLNAPELLQVDFSKVRFFISGGAPCPVSLIEAWRAAVGGILRQGYGLTEVGVNCFTMTDEESLRKAGSVGKPVFHSRARIVSPDGSELPAGETGEMVLYGPHVCLGYWRNPEATAKSLRDGWFHTGDMAYQDEQGYFYMSGRYKDMIISGGENVYAAEVETVFLEHPAVAEAALIGQPDEKWGEVGVMVVVLRPGVEPAQEELLKIELLEFCQGRLARYKIPRRVCFTNALPYSPYGKVIKSELKKQFIEPFQGQGG